MRDNVSIDARIHLSQNQWNILWGCALLLVGVRPTKRGAWKSISAGTPGEVPTKVAELLGDEPGEVRVEAPVAGTYANTGCVVVHVTLENVPRDTDSEFKRELTQRGFTTLARDSEEWGSAGAGSTEIVLAGHGSAMQLRCSVPTYCDDECDAWVTLTLAFGTPAQLATFAAREIKGINTQIVDRVRDALRVAQAQRASLVPMLAKLVSEVQANELTAEDAESTQELLPVVP